MVAVTFTVRLDKSGNLSLGMCPNQAACQFFKLIIIVLFEIASGNNLSQRFLICIEICGEKRIGDKRGLAHVRAR